MAVIWGLDLKEMQWGKFKNSYMWANIYHLRRTKFIVYQLAMILCVVSESLGTDALSSYVDEQKNVVRESNLAGDPADIYNNDIVGAFSYNIFAGVYVATIFGAAFFFDLFWPERRESRAVRIAWRVNAVLAVLVALSSALVLTVVLATHRAEPRGNVPDDVVLSPPLQYSQNGEAIASVVLIWLGTVATAASAWLMHTSISHNSKYGPIAAHLRGTKEAETHPFLSHGDPSSASNGAGAAGSSALERGERHSTRNSKGTNGNGNGATTNGAELSEKPLQHDHHTGAGAGVNGTHSSFSTGTNAEAGYADPSAPVPEPYTINHNTGVNGVTSHTTGPTTVVNGPSTTTTTTTTTVAR